MTYSDYIAATILLLDQLDSLLWIYPFIWAVIIVRKLFYV